MCKTICCTLFDSSTLRSENEQYFYIVLAISKAAFFVALRCQISKRDFDDNKPLAVLV